ARQRLPWAKRPAGAATTSANGVTLRRYRIGQTCVAGYELLEPAPPRARNHTVPPRTTVTANSSRSEPLSPLQARPAGSPCRFCRQPLRHTFVDLGMSPPCQTHITAEQLNSMEAFYPLHAYVCEHCFLVQLEEFVGPADIFSEYAYFSSYSDSWVAHAKRYADQMCEMLGLGGTSSVMEIASNDGYLLQHFVARGVPVLGIEPAANVAEVAREKGVRTIVKFFGHAAASEIAKEYGKPDLLLGNKVLAHVPDLNDFVSGMKALLGERGTITMEFPHLYRLVQENQF